MHQPFLEYELIHNKYAKDKRAKSSIVMCGVIFNGDITKFYSKVMLINSY